MPREQLHSDDLKIDQKAPIIGDRALAERDGEVVIADQSMLDKDYTEELKFMEEPVTIRLEPSTEKNASNRLPVWVNGIGAEMLINGRWVQVTWLPIGQQITIKRKAFEVIIRAKIDRIETDVDDANVENPQNRIKRHTAPVNAYSVIQDSVLGHEWAKELMRRNM